MPAYRHLGCVQYRTACGHKVRCEDDDGAAAATQDDQSWLVTGARLDLSAIIVSPVDISRFNVLGLPSFRYFN